MPIRRCCCKCKCCRHQQGGTTVCKPCTANDTLPCCDDDEPCEPPPCLCCSENQGCDEFGHCLECSYQDRCPSTGQCPTPYPECKCDCLILSCQYGEVTAECSCPPPPCPDCFGGLAPPKLWVTIPPIECPDNDNGCCGSCSGARCDGLDYVYTNSRRCDQGGTFELFNGFECTEHHDDYDPTKCGHQPWNYSRQCLQLPGNFCGPWVSAWTALSRNALQVSTTGACCAPSACLCGFKGLNEGCDGCDDPFHQCPCPGYADALNQFAWGNVISAYYGIEPNGVIWYVDVLGYGKGKSPLIPFAPGGLVTCCPDTSITWDAIELPGWTNGPGSCKRLTAVTGSLTCVPPPKN